MRALLLAGVGLALAGCPSVDDEPSPGPDIADLTFEDFGTWARPIEDYLEFHEADLGHDQFDRSIQALHVFGDRLYLGYGDATLNLGRTTPIEVRSFAEPEPDAWEAEFVVDEEAIGRYRGTGDVLLIPGVDATEDAWLGNAYERGVDDGSWIKSRTLDQALHVHDALLDDDGTRWACGSGGTPEEYDAGAISSLVFRSADDGVTYELAWKVPNSNPVGDARFTSLAKVDGALHAFGYRSDGASINELIAYRDAGGDEPERWDAMSAVLVDDVISLPDGRALATGVYAGSPLSFTVRLLDGDDADEVDAFADLAVHDLFDLADGRVVTLATDGAGYPLADGPYTVEVGIWDASDETYTTLKRQDSNTRPLSLAFWRDSLYVGLTDGRIRQALGLEEGT